MTTPICVIDANGITAPAFADCLTYFQQQYQSIYGQDIYLGNDSQDGQFLGLLAAALNDVNAECVAAYEAYSPSTAQGVGLSSVVKINAMARKVPSFSTVDLTVVGQAGTTISNGIAVDQNNNQWNLPAQVNIPPQGQIVVTATAADLGAVTAPANTVTTIGTPTRGWQQVYNVDPATPGQPVESDAQLRVRQSNTAALPSQNRLAGIIAAIEAIPDVVAYRAYENDGLATDSNGIPRGAVSLVVDGGNIYNIAQAILVGKSIGTSTYGTTQQVISDAFGIPHIINLFLPTIVPITMGITVKALTGFTTDIQNQIVTALVDWVNALGIGNSLLITRAYVPANLSGGLNSNTFEIQAITAARDSNSLQAADIPIAFNEMASIDTNAIAVTVTT